jgi:hypothetical protein
MLKPTAQFNITAAQLHEMACAVRASGTVMKRSFKDGKKLFMHPADFGVILGVGLEQDQAREVRTERVLQRRSVRPEIYACWLPAVFSDGSWFLLRRLHASQCDQPEFFRQVDLSIPLELLTA